MPTYRPLPRSNVLAQGSAREGTGRTQLKNGYPFQGGFILDIELVVYLLVYTSGVYKLVVYKFTVKFTEVHTLFWERGSD